MDTLDLIYSEVKILRKDVSILRKEFNQFKIKVIIYAACISAGTGGVVAKLLPMLS